MSRHQQLLRVDFEEPFRTDAAALAVDVESLLAKVKVLVLSDYGKGALQNHQVLIQAARARNIPVLADPKGKDFAIYRGASLITRTCRIQRPSSAVAPTKPNWSPRARR